MWRREPRVALALVLTGALLGACSDDGAVAGDAGDAADAGTTQTSESLDITVQFDGAGPKVGQNSVEIVLTKLPEGTPFEGATVDVNPQMPVHGHGSTEVPVVEELGGGKYRAFPVTFQMPGAWELRITVTKDGQTAGGIFEIAVK